MANIFRMKHDVDNQTRWKVQGVPHIVPKFLELWSTNGLNWAGVLPTLSILLRSQSIAHALSGVNVAHHGESKLNGIGLSATQIQSSKRF